MAARKHFVRPSYDPLGQARDPRALGGIADELAGRTPPDNANQMPYYYNQYDGLPVAYSAPDEQKENFRLQQAILSGANKAILADTPDGQAPGVQRTLPITESEVSYLKSMKDQAELAKFDDYVESFIDPRMPGNMKFLMEVYPDYVTRRLQQAHTDYEFALRNQMIDCWGINTFDDLHFKYLVDQGKIEGPSLQRDTEPVDSRYTPGWLSPFNFQSPNPNGNIMKMPFSSAKHGRRPPTADAWTLDRSNRALGQGNNDSELVMGMYNLPAETARPGIPDRPAGTRTAQRNARANARGLLNIR
jgi:hypothetical protein